MIFKNNWISVHVTRLMVFLHSKPLLLLLLTVSIGFDVMMVAAAEAKRKRTAATLMDEHSCLLLRSGHKMVQLLPHAHCVTDKLRKALQTFVLTVITHLFREHRGLKRETRLINNNNSKKKNPYNLSAQKLLLTVCYAHQTVHNHFALL